MVLGKFGSAYLRAGVDQDLAGRARDAPAAFVAMGDLYFDSVEVFQEF